MVDLKKKMKKPHPLSLLQNEEGYILIIVTVIGLILAIIFGNIMPRLHTAQMTRAMNNLNEMRAYEAARKGINTVELGLKELDNFQELIGYEISGITKTDQAGNSDTFEITGRYAYIFPSGVSFTVYYSTSNDGTYAVSGSSEYDVSGVSVTGIAVGETISGSTDGVLCRNRGMIWAIDQIIGGVSEPLKHDEYYYAKNYDADSIPIDASGNSVQFVSGCSIDVSTADYPKDRGELHMAVIVTRGGDFSGGVTLYFYNNGLLNNSGTGPWLTENTAPAGITWNDFSYSGGSAYYCDFDLGGVSNYEKTADFKYWYENNKWYISVGTNGAWRGQYSGNELWNLQQDFLSGTTPFQGKDNDGDGDIENDDNVEVFVIVRSTGITAASGPNYVTDKTSLRLVREANSHLPNPMRQVVEGGFYLEREAQDWCPSPSFLYTGLWSYRLDDGSEGTSFWASIHGPSPLDIASFTVTSPGVTTFNLSPVITSLQDGLFYAHTEPAPIVPNGSYTFMITDKFGRTDTVIKDFTYDPTIPKVTSGMTPYGGTYVGTTTPTLSWDPVPGDVYYRVDVKDYDYKAIWYISPTSQVTSVTVPEGYLRPDMPYIWYVRVYDNPYPNRRNMHESGHTVFFTGTTPYTIDLTERMVFHWNELSGSSRIGMAVKDLEVAPWSIDQANSGVTTPDTSWLNFTGRSPRFDGVYLYTTGTSIFLDGDYTFRIQDDLNSAVTGISGLTIDPVPAILEASRVPEDNAYFPENKPIFSWDAISGPTPYYYFLRIWDYNERLPCYSSGITTATSATGPDDLAYSSSYKWEVYALDDNVWNQVTNIYSSPKRTFTIYRADPPKVRRFHFGQAHNLED